MIRQEQARRSLKEFARQAWHVVEPATPFIDNWHIDAICLHLEAVSRGQIRQLLINMPPRHMKSLLVSVFWPCWEWLTWPEHRWLYASYAQSLSIRDSLKCRRLIQSPWYQTNFGSRFHLLDDQNAKIRFENNRLGYRLATSVGGALTGEGGDRIVVDDPHNVKESESQVKRQATLTWWDEAMSTRLNSPRTGAKVIVMQRVHADDLSAHVLATGDWEHLNLPAEYEGDEHITAIGWRDPRTEIDELLWSARIDRTALDRLKRTLGAYAYAGQFQQRPTPRGGGTFKRDWWMRFRVFDRKAASQIIQVWDTAFSTKTSADYSVCSTWAQVGNNFYVIDVFKDRVEFPDLKREAKASAARWQPSAILIEQKASGQSLLQELRRETTLPVVPIKVDKDKLTRASAVTPYVEAGRVFLPQSADWVDDWIYEHAAFPNAPHDDLVDTTSMALSRLAGGGDTNVLDWYRQKLGRQDDSSPPAPAIGSWG